MAIDVQNHCSLHYPIGDVCCFEQHPPVTAFFTIAGGFDADGRNDPHLFLPGPGYRYVVTTRNYRACLPGIIKGHGWRLDNLSASFA